MSADRHSHIATNSRADEIAAQHPIRQYCFIAREANTGMSIRLHPFRPNGPFLFRRCHQPVIHLLIWQSSTLIVAAMARHALSAHLLMPSAPEFASLAARNATPHPAISTAPLRVAGDRLISISCPVRFCLIVNITDHVVSHHVTSSSPLCAPAPEKTRRGTTGCVQVSLARDRLRLATMRILRCPAQW